MSVKHYNACPACDSGSIRLVESVETARIAEAWSKISATAKDALRTEIEGENIPHQTQIYHCDRCQLEFANPMYSALSDWYAEVEQYGIRWEFQQCLADINPSSTLLEIGCGEGYFLELAMQAGHQTLGLDFNPKAIKIAQAKGLNAQCWDLKKLGAQQQTFDRVAFFHVLEHIDDLDSFFADLSALTTKDASLHFSCPHPQRYTELIDYHRLGKREYWDYPPHHQTRWVPSAIEQLLNRLGWKLIKTMNEPFHWVGVSGYLARLKHEQQGQLFADLSPIRRKTAIVAQMMQTLIPSRHYSGISLYCVAVRA
ncbi:class I SAM-dependent methyltransferase [Leptolyngbya sp. AN03gr2]|uniref:class I SAM-dependent methyltransferase n=1 Tax=unclassified Leptolyngbya TaxID=2650499 RepID=UPI003D31F950